MKKSIKYIIIIAIIIGVIIFLAKLAPSENSANNVVSNNYNTQKTENSVTNTQNTTNKVLENNVIEENTTNTVEEVTNTANQTNTIETQTTTSETQNKSEETEIKDNTNEKDKAIELAKKEWGEDSSVYYTNEGDSDGIFKVAVRDKSNTSVKLFYKVDLKNKTVEIDW